MKGRGSAGRGGGRRGGGDGNGRHAGVGRHPAGGGLVEILVALVVLEVGLLGVVGLLLGASRTLAAAAVLERAVTLAGGVADSLLTAPVVRSGEGREGSLKVRWDPVEGGMSVSVRAPDAVEPVLELRVPLGPGLP